MYTNLFEASQLPTPWCFESKGQWLTWLSLAYSSRNDKSKDGFNANPCRDCTTEYQAKMIRKGDCSRPDWDTTKEYTS